MNAEAFGQLKKLLISNTNILQTSQITEEFINDCKSFKQIEKYIEKITSVNASNANLKQLDIILPYTIGIQFLHLSGNSISTIISLNTYRNLVVLDLSHNYIPVLSFSSFWNSQRYIQVLLLNNNQVNDTTQVKSLQKLPLSYLTIHSNKLKRTYRNDVLKILPKLLVLDNQAISVLQNSGVDQQFLQNYINSEYFNTKKQLTNEKIPLNNKEMIDFQIQLIELQGQSCPVLILQKNIRMYLVIKRQNHIKYNFTSSVVYIQSYYRMFRERVVYFAVIKKALRVQRNAVTLIRYFLRRRLKFRDYELTLFKKIKEDISARIITRCLRKYRNDSRICTQNVMDTKIYINKEHANPYVQKIKYNEQTKRYELTLFIAKTFDIEQGAFISFQRLCKFMVDEIRSMLSLDPNNTLKQLNIDGLTYKQTNYQLQLGSVQKICIRGIKSMKEVQQNIILRQHLNVKLQIINAKLQKKLIMSTNQLKNSTYLKIIKMLNDYIAKETYVPEEAEEDISLKFVNTKFVQRCTVEDNHDQMSNTPYFIQVQIDNQELISMFMYFFNTVYGQVFECDQKPKAIQELLKYGQHICEHLMPTTTKQTSQEVFSQHDLSISMYRKNIKQKLYIVTESTLYPLQLAIKIQKIYRMWRSNRKVLAGVNKLYIEGIQKSIEDISKLKNGQKIVGTSPENLKQNSIQQVFLIQRATRIIQRNIRGSNGRFRHLLFWKMRDVFKSALQHQCFYIRKSVFQKLVAGKLAPNRFTSLHCNLSEPVSTSNAYRIFYNKDVQLNVQQLFQDMGYYTQHYRQLCTLILHGQKNRNASSSQDKLFSCFTSHLYSAKKAVNNGYIQLKSLFMGESPLNSRWLKTWVQGVPNMQDQKFEFLGVAIKSKLNSHTEKLNTGYDALKSMCGLQFHGQQENSKADKLLSMFEIELLKQSFDIQRLVKNVFDFGVKIKEIQGYSDYLKVCLNEEENCNVCDLALKSLVLEMTFCHPIFMPYNNFISRSSYFVTHGGIQVSANAYELQKSAIVVQKHIKKTIQYWKYLELPRQTSFIKKIMMLCQQSDSDLSTSKEKAAVQVIQSNYLDRETQNALRQERKSGQLKELNDVLIIKKPEFRIMDKTMRLQQQKQLEAQRQRYQYCVQKSTIAEKQQKFLDDNKIKIQVVKRIVQTSNDQRYQRINAISQLNKLKQTMKVNSVQTAGLLDDQMKNQILLTLRDGEEAGITIPEQIADLLDSVYDINQENEDLEGQKLNQINICNNKITNTPNYRPRIPSPERSSQQHQRIKMMYQQEQRLKNATLRDTTRKRLNSTTELLKEAKTKRKAEYEEYYRNLKQMKEKRDQQVINDLKDRVQQQRQEQIAVASQLKNRMGLSNTLRNAMSVNQSRRTSTQ